MFNKHLVFHCLTLLLYLTLCYGRVVYVVIHAEKPGVGSMDESVPDGLTMSSMEGLGYPPDGLVRILSIS